MKVNRRLLKQARGLLLTWWCWGLILLVVLMGFNGCYLWELHREARDWEHATMEAEAGWRSTEDSLQAYRATYTSLREALDDLRRDGMEVREWNLNMRKHFFPID